MPRSQRFPAQPRTCVWCGSVFTPPEHGKKAENCSTPCRKRTKRVLLTQAQFAAAQRDERRSGGHHAA